MLNDRRADFEAKGIRLVAIGSIPDNAEAFKTAVWEPDDVYVDEGDVFKTALGGGKYKNWWLAKPSVIAAIVRALSYGGAQDDLNAKTSTMGGTVLVKDSKVLFSKVESSSFGYASPDEVLKALE